MNKKIISSISIFLIAIFSAFFVLKYKNPTRPLESYAPQITTNQSETQQKNAPQKENDQEIKFVGPRDNIPKGAPKEEGFWSFAYSIPNVLSRSGQPTLEEFQWLKDNGWKSDINLRIDGDHNEQADDAKIPGFSQIGLNYLHIQIVDGAAPTNEQAEQFLNFITDQNNLPAHVHCRGGIGRAGTMIALYRYSVQGWPMDQAIKESRKFSGGVSKAQEKWLNTWAQNHAPGSFNTAS